MEKRLTAKQARALAAILDGGDAATAAQAAGVSVRTVERWRGDEGFRRAMADALADVHRQALGELVRAATEATRTLVDLLSDRHPAHVRCSAAVAILRAGREHLELDDHGERLTRIERILDERQKP